MGLALRDIEEQALQLSAEEREILAGRLLHSVEDVPPSEVDEAWIEVAEQRYQDHLSGTAQGVPGDQVFSDIRRKLGWRG